jgi:hypothetical protein
LQGPPPETLLILSRAGTREPKALKFFKQAQVQSLERDACRTGLPHDGFHGVPHRELTMTVTSVPSLMRSFLPIVGENQELTLSGL